jgi:hypothetical protein
MYLEYGLSLLHALFAGKLQFLVSFGRKIPLDYRTIMLDYRHVYVTLA